MNPVHRFRAGRIAIVASAAMLLLGGAAARAQTIPVFDDAPTIEQLRSIMAPESPHGISRSIVIQRPDSTPPEIQQVSTQAAPAPRPRVATAARVRAEPPAAPPVAKPDESADGHAVAFHVNFAFNSTALPPDAHGMMDTMVQVLKESPEIKVRIEGHTDAVGSAAYNLALSKHRAVSVAEYLVSQGVDPSRLELVGKGMSAPLVRNRYDPTNRRVQFVRIG
jgi:outer membrane protein OmpA-like peptidoglycan-associated protein